MSENPNQTKVLENEEMYSYGEQIAQQEKGMFFQGNYVIYMGENEDIQEIIDNHFQKYVMKKNC